jgi:hypothetical protein
MKWVKLIDVGNSVEADSLEVLLRSFDIPTLIKPSGAGGYMEIYMGSTNLGVEILVPDDEFERASEIVQAYASRSYDATADGEDDLDDEDLGDGSNPEKKISAVKWVIGIIAFLTIGGFIVACLIETSGSVFSIF